MRHPADRWQSRAGLALYLAALLWLTLAAYPDAAAGGMLNLEPGRTIAVCAQIGGAVFVWNVVGNIAAFVPLGIALRAGVVGRPWRFRWVLEAGALFSLFIEVMQYRGGLRVADVDDVILNAAGALAGAILLDVVVLVVAAVARDRGVAAGGRVG